MNSFARTMVFSMLLFNSTWAFGQQSNAAGASGGIEPASSPNASASTGRSLDDVRTALREKNAEDGEMGSSGMAMGSGAMAMGGPGMSMGGMPAGMMGGMEGALPPSEKQQLAQLIQQLRGRLESKKFKRENVEKQLRSALREYFETDLQERVTEFDKVKAKVTEMEAKLQRRLDSESEIVELQLKQMLHKADGLDFSIPGGNGGGEGMMGGYGGAGGEMGGDGYGMEGMGMGAGSGASGGGDGGMGGAGYGDGEGSNANTIGYDVLFRTTRLERLDTRGEPLDLDALDDLDPLKSYDQVKTLAAGTETADSEAEKLGAILSAFHLFHERFQHFPKSENRQVTGQPPHSWRVAILPLIGQSELYKQYRFDQPWDSEPNLQVAKNMPDLYRSTQSAFKGSTLFKMIVGGGALDSSKTPAQFSQITDGTSNTLALVQSDKEVFWTKPEDVKYTPTGPLPALSTSRLVGLADGTTMHLPKLDDKDFRALITRAGGEIVEFLKN